MRPPGRILKLTRQMRQRIRSGAWQPESALPTRTRLADEWHVPSATVQEAIGRLVAEGSLVTRKRGGTHVAVLPPEMHQIAVVLPATDPLHPTRNLFRQTLIAATHTLASRTGVSITRHDTLDAALHARIVGDGIAGVVTMHGHDHAEVALKHGVPLVAIAAPDSQLQAQGIASVSLNNASLLRVGVSELVKRGYRRIAVLATTGAIDDAFGNPHKRADPPRILARCRTLGATMPDHWLQFVDPLEPRAATQVVRLLLAVHPRPQAILLLDDHLAAPVRVLLAQTGIRMATLTNHTCPTDSGLHIGCTAEALLAAAINLIRKTRNGDVPGKHLRLAAHVIADVPEWISDFCEDKVV